MRSRIRMNAMQCGRGPSKPFLAMSYPLIEIHNMRILFACCSVMGGGTGPWSEQLADEKLSARLQSASTFEIRPRAFGARLSIIFPRALVDCISRSRQPRPIVVVLGRDNQSSSNGEALCDYSLLFTTTSSVAGHPQIIFTRI